MKRIILYQEHPTRHYTYLAAALSPHYFMRPALSLSLLFALGYGEDSWELAARIEMYACN